MPVPLLVTFAAGVAGDWRVDRIEPVRGAGLEGAARLAVVEGTGVGVPTGARWTLRGVTSHLRYTTEVERRLLIARQPELGRLQATRAALIPIRKREAWWMLAQDERRAILEERTQHISTGVKYLPAVARRLMHCRDLGEPFDFLTWFEYAPEDAGAFEELVGRLRESEEWSYVEREVDVRLTRGIEDGVRTP
ncbi:MAG TPA: chlorite dismutase family protein [Methylomirabilota bacterium]|nr:chlorite dismutase family protein [Methylomirabilota bacterium]